MRILNLRHTPPVTDAVGQSGLSYHPSGSCTGMRTRFETGRCSDPPEVEPSWVPRGNGAVDSSTLTSPSIIESSDPRVPWRVHLSNYNK